MVPRPRITLPIWSVPAIVAGLYVVRSLQHGDWRPDLPDDVLVLVMAAIVMAAVAELRSSLSAEDTDDATKDGTSRDDAGGPEA